MTNDMLPVLKALSERTRLRIVKLLMEQELCVCEMMFVLGLAQSRLSHQLRILRAAGLVEDMRDGQWIIYRIAPGMQATITGLFALFPRTAAKDVQDDLKDQKKLKTCFEKGFRKKRDAGEDGKAAPAGSAMRTGA